MTQKLHDWCAGQEVESVQILRNPGGRYEAEGSVGRTIDGVYRRGKRIVFVLSDKNNILCHNAMSGFWDTEDEPWTFDYVEGSRKSTESDVRAILTLKSGRRLRFHDSRLFGSIQTIEHVDLLRKFNLLGPEAIETLRMFSGAPVFNVLDAAVFFTDKKPIKQLLMEQDRIAGIGNIYAAEALWRARVSPSRRGDSLTTDQIGWLSVAIGGTLRIALEQGLRYNSYLQVYRRKSCSTCSGPIEKEEIAGRSTYFCPKCQV